MRFKIFLIALLSSFLVACTQSSETPPPAIKIPELSSLSGGTLRLKTTDDPILVESSLIYTDDGNLIADGISFRLVADVIKISNDSLTWVSELVVSTHNGKFQFYLQTNHLVGLYRVNAFPVSNEAIKFSQGINSRFFVDVVPGDPNNIGSMFSDRFEELSPYNGVKDSSESWLVTSNPDLITYVGIGPIVDSYNNIINDGTITLSVDSGSITSENPTRILSGYAYFSYKANGLNGDLNIHADLNHPSNVALSIDQVLKKASPSLNFLDTADFSNMLANETRCSTIRLRNDGSMVGTYLDLASLTPFQLVDESVSDPLCPLTSDVCKLRQDLRSGEICKVRIKFTMPSTSVTDGELSARVNPQEFASSTSILPLRTQVVQAAKLVASNSFISFGATQCSSTRTLEMYVQNVGDYDATNISIQNPPPYIGQSTPFFTLTSPPADVSPNPDFNQVINCGTNFPAHRRCRIIIQYNPTGTVNNQALTARINSDNVNPLLITLSGYTIPGVPVGGFPIQFVTPNNSILPLGMNVQNGQRSTVNVGPILDACSNVVSDGTIVNASVSGGFLSSIVGVTNSGYVSFVWNSVSDINLIGNQSINVTAGTQLVNSSLQFKGVILDLTGNTDLGEVIEQKPRTEIYTLSNTGNIDAQNISITGTSLFVVLDKGTCNSGVLAAGSSCQITIQAAPQNLNQDLTAVLIGSSSSAGSNQASLNIAIKARTKPILTFTSDRYLFNDGTSNSVFYRTITLTNNGPATSNNTQIFADAPFFINSTTCLSTFLANTSCQITLGLNSTDINDVTDKKVYVVNEIDNGSPFASLTFSELKFTNTPLKTLVGRCAGPFYLGINGQIGVVAPTSNTVVNLSSSSGASDGLFYSDSSCLTNINQTTILSGNSQSNSFYFRSLVGIDITLLAQNASFPITGQTLISKNEITLDQTLGLIIDEVYPLSPNGGFSNYTITFNDNSSTSTYADIVDVLDSNNIVIGRNLLVKSSIPSAQVVNIKVLDGEGFSRIFPINILPAPTGGSLAIGNNDPTLVPHNLYGNLNAKTFELKHYDSGTASYVSGSLYGSTLDSSGYYTAGGNVPSATTEYAFLTVNKYTGGSTVVIIPITVNLAWPFGTLGDLTINNGQTVTLAAGSTYDYNNITINNGGTLNISGVGTVVLGASGNVVINGTINSAYNYNNGNNHTFYDPFTKSNVSLSQSQASGGSGGRGGVAGIPGSITYDSVNNVLQCSPTNYGLYQLNSSPAVYICLFVSNNGGLGGNGTAGCGGGGGGGGGFNSGGGAGGSGCGNGNQGDAQGGAGNATLGNGGNGNSAGGDAAGSGGLGGGSGGGGGGDSSAQYDGGGGGGGGRKGAHANSLFLRTKGSISGTGTINLVGANGYNGGSGASGNRAFTTYNSTAGVAAGLMNTGTGGGGGGGAGGSGGHVYLYYKGSNTLSPSNIFTNGGIGGNGGGRMYSSYPSPNSANGSNGSTGVTGSKTISNY